MLSLFYLSSSFLLSPGPLQTLLREITGNGPCPRLPLLEFFFFFGEPKKESDGKKQSRLVFTCEAREVIEAVEEKKNQCPSRINRSLFFSFPVPSRERRTEVFISAIKLGAQ